LKDKVLAGSCKSRGSESRVHENEVEVLKGLWLVPQGTHTFARFYNMNPAVIRDHITYQNGWGHTWQAIHTC